MADVGIHIHYNESAFLKERHEAVTFNSRSKNQVGVLKIYPGIPLEIIESVAQTKDLKALIIETYGSGNAPTNDAFIAALQKVIDRGIVVVNITQCIAGAVNQGHYETSSKLAQMGVYSGKDITFEAGMSKLMFLLGQGLEGKALGEAFIKPICGEMMEN